MVRLSVPIQHIERLLLDLGSIHLLFGGSDRLYSRHMGWKVRRNSQKAAQEAKMASERRWTKTCSCRSTNESRKGQEKDSQYVPDRLLASLSSPLETSWRSLFVLTIYGRSALSSHAQLSNGVESEDCCSRRLWRGQKKELRMVRAEAVERSKNLSTILSWS